MDVHLITLLALASTDDSFNDMDSLLDQVPSARTH